jgi:hypothetical protein
LFSKIKRDERGETKEERGAGRKTVELMLTVFLDS